MEIRSAANAAQAARWNGESGRYWITNRERLLAGHRNLLRHLFSAAAITPGERVLDIGCGCGATTLAAARAARGGKADLQAAPPGQRDGNGGCAVGFDISGPMLRVARRLAVPSSAANAVFVQCDAQGCPARRASSDIIISSFGVMFFEDPAAAFKRFAAAVRPGGRLAFLCWQHDTQNELIALPIRAFGPYTALPLPTTGELFADPQEVRNLLSRTGWADINVSAVREPAWIGSDVADVMKYVRSMPLIRSLSRDLSNHGLTEQALASIAGQYAARQQPDGVWVRAAAWLATAQRA